MTDQPTNRKACTMTYSDPATGKTRACQDGTPRAAAWKRGPVRVCQDCWPEVKAALLAKYGMDAPAWIQERAIAKAFKRVA